MALFMLSSAFGEMELDPLQGQMVGFISLTIPVFLYFYLSERGKIKATIGKRLMNIQVNSLQGRHKRNILVRNMLKFLPWEIAHVGVHWIVFYSSNHIETPMWVWIILILPQLIVLTYMVSIVVSKGRGGMYDQFASTSVGMRNA
jgi:uncharacterized RDD family membrane protein YckC